MSKTVIFFALTLLTLTSCTRTQWVASVGGQRISKNAVELREKMMKTFDPAMNQKTATEQMINFELRKKILESRGLTVSEGEVQAFLEFQRNEAKKNPTIAGFLKEFEKDPAFKEVYLYPQVAEKKARELFDKDEAFNKKEMETANLLMQKAQADTAHFENVAKDMGIPILKGVINASTGMIQWEAGREVASQSKVPGDKAWFGQGLKNNYLLKVEAGKMVPNLYPIWFGYLVMRSDKITKEELQFTMAIAPRRAQWMWEKEQTMTVNVLRFQTEASK